MVKAIDSGHTAMNIINVTPHTIRFSIDGEVVTIEPSGFTARAKPQEVEVGKHERTGATLVRIEYVGTPEVEAQIREMQEANPDAILVGSIVSAAAYPGMIFGMVPMPGTERLIPEEKVTNGHKFFTY